MDGLELFCCFRDWGRVEMQREEGSWGGKGRLQIGRITEYQWGPCQVGWKLLFCSPVCRGQNRHFLSLMMICADWNTGSVDTRVLLATAVYAVPVSFLEQLLISHQYFVQWSMQKACTVCVSSDKPGAELLQLIQQGLPSSFTPFIGNEVNRSREQKL